MLDAVLSAQKSGLDGTMTHGRNISRLPVTGKVRIEAILTKESEEGALVDVSRKGARMIVSRRFQRDQKLSLTLQPRMNFPPIVILLATVRWMRGTHLGVEFIDIEANDQTLLDIVLSSPTKP
ncbi:MAG: PilZ domain-containing protein [Nitrospira sp.]|nr:PilZ domain-containing protein [Nitrospira sp.]